MPNATIHTHCQVAQCNRISQNLSKSMAAQRTVVNRYYQLEKENSTGIQQGLRKHRGLVVFGSSELLENPPIQNFDNEKSKVYYKNIWLGYMVNRKGCVSKPPPFLSQALARTHINHAYEIK